jgi:hypothetical protein
VLVLVGVRSTAVSVWVVVVAVAGSLTTVVQDESPASAKIATNRMSVFISRFIAFKGDSRQLTSADGFGRFFYARASGA